MLVYQVIKDDENTEEAKKNNCKCSYCNVYTGVFVIGAGMCICRKCQNLRINYKGNNMSLNFVKTKNGAVRTISDYSLTELEEIFKNFIPTNDTGCINKVERIFEDTEPKRRFEWINKN